MRLHANPGGITGEGSGCKDAGKIDTTSYPECNLWPVTEAANVIPCFPGAKNLQCTYRPLIVMFYDFERITGYSEMTHR